MTRFISTIIDNVLVNLSVARLSITVTQVLLNMMGEKDLRLPREAKGVPQETSLAK